MKLNDLKHNHSLTDLLKVIIFSILMLMPFLAIATRCLYVVCNKNAYQSYSNETLQSLSRVTNNNQFLEHETYHILYYKPSSQVNADATRIRIDFYESDIDFVSLGFNQSNINGYGITYTGSFNMAVYNDGTQLATANIDINKIKNVTLTLKAVTSPNAYELLNQNFASYDIYYITTDKLDNVFEYSIDQVTQSNLFNWTQNTGIYTGINTMTTQLGIVGVFIPMLLTYWFLLTVIYIIIDIVLKTFTVISHMLIKKAE